MTAVERVIDSRGERDSSGLDMERLREDVMKDG